MKDGKFVEGDYKFPENDIFSEMLRRKWLQKDKKYAKFYYKKKRARSGEFTQGKNEEGEKFFSTDFNRDGLGLNISFSGNL